MIGFGLGFRAKKAAGTAVPAPLDALSANLIAAFGHRNMLSSFSGSYRTDDGSTCSEWIDQSGNVNHASQATSNIRPTVRDDAICIATGHALTQYMSLPTATTFDGRNFTIVGVIDISSSDGAIYALSAAGIGFVMIAEGGSLKIFSGTNRTTTIKPPAQKVAIAIVGTGSGCTAYMNSVASASAVSVLSSGTVDNIRIGHASTPARSTFYELAYINTALSETDLTPILANMVQFHGIQDRTGAVICDGDSITQGTGSTLNKSWPSLLTLPASTWRFNMGITGQTSTQLVADFSETTALVQSGDLVLINIGTNDMSGGLTASQIYDNIVSAVTSANSAGAGNVGVFTVVSGSDNAKRVALNALLRADNAGADFLLDQAADATLGASDATGTKNTPALWADGAHPNDAGYAALAAWVDGVIAPYLP